MVKQKRLNQLISIISILCLVFLSMYVCISPTFFSSQAEEINPLISIINVQSYPKQGGFWTVSFRVKGTADLRISAVEETTWNTEFCQECDLIFKSVKNETKTFEYQWENGSIIIKNFNSSTVVREISKVFTIGKHVLKFTFGNSTVYAYNDASNWWNNQWGYRKKITINQSQISGNLENFPIYVNISDNDLKLKAEPNGKDIAFISFEDNTTKFDHEIENYSQGNLTTWVKIPNLSSSDTKSFWMYYNNSECETQENSSGVWDDNYVLVHHFNETDIDGGTNDIKDSTQNNNDGFTSNMDTNDQVPGKSDGCFDFDGDNDYVQGNLSLDPITNQFTISDWITVSSLNDQYNHISLGKNGEIRVVPFINASNNINCYFGNDTSNTVLSSDSIITSIDSWYYISCTYNATNLSIYVNGELKNSTVVSYSLTDNEYVIGADISKASFFHYGKIDETRISNIARNQSWIQTSYNTIQNQSVFFTLGSEESASPTASNPNPSNGNYILADVPNNFEITVFDPNPDSLNITWMTNHSGIWETFNVTNGGGLGVADGSYQALNTSWVTEFDKIYWWSVNVTDGTHWTNETYSFLIHQFDPVINSFLLMNDTGNKLNNITGNLDVESEYVFSINITEKNGWQDVDYVNVTSWFDFGDDSSTYNSTSGGNYNLFLQYLNTSGTAQFNMIWPDNESDLAIINCTEISVNQTTRIINISFIPGNQSRCATSNETWNLTNNNFNDLFSWNVNCSVEDTFDNNDYVFSEFGVNYFSSLKAPDLIEISGAPGMTEQSNVFTINFISNADYTLKIYFDDNLTQVDGPDIIGIDNNLSLLENADENDDLLLNTTFSGTGNENAIIILENRSSPSDNKEETVLVQLEITIPFGTWGTYSTNMIKKIERVL